MREITAIKVAGSGRFFSLGRTASSSVQRQTAAHATRRKEKPVHEDAFAVVVRVVGQQTMPLVLLLATAVSAATCRSRLTKNVAIFRITRLVTFQSFAYFYKEFTF